MNTETKVLGGILILTLVLLLGGIFFLSKSSSNSQTVDQTNMVQIDYSKGQKIGSGSAKVKLVEFSDFECPACAAAEPYVKKIITDYSADKVQVIYRHFPLPQHLHSQEAASLAEAAAAEGKFWEMHDKLFETQTQWSSLKDATPFFLDLAKQVGIEEDKARKAIQDKTYASIIDGDKAEGIRLGVNSTPTFFLNGRKLNLKSFSDLNQVVADEIKKN